MLNAPTRRLASALVPALLATVVLVAACGDEGGDEPKSLAVEAVEPAQDRYGLQVPESVESGLVEIEFTNSGKQEHEAQLLKVEDGHTTEQALRAFDGILQGRPAPDWFRARGGIGTTAPGRTQKVTQRLEPGSYIFVDSNEPTGRDVEPFYKQGAVAELTVTGDATDKSLPEADATVTAAEYSFSPSGLKSGPNTIEFRNAGGQWHHLLISRIRSGSTIEDVKTFFRTERGRSPIEEGDVVETAVIDGGEAQLTEVDLEPGNYALLCFIPDRSGGPPHVAKGMISEAQVP